MPRLALGQVECQTGAVDLEAFRWLLSADGQTLLARTAEVYARLRSDILAGRLPPGSRLPFAELGARYESSMSAIREGLQRLVEQGICHERRNRTKSL